MTALLIALWAIAALVSGQIIISGVVIAARAAFRLILDYADDQFRLRSGQQEGAAARPPFPAGA